MDQRNRLVMAFLLAPLVPAAIYIVEHRYVIFLAYIPVAVAYGHGVLGLAAYLWLRSKRKLSTVAMLCASAIIGALPISWILATGLIASMFSSHTHARVGEATAALVLILQAAALGLSGGVTWRIIAGRPVN
jgi:hypothetical protein